jgi:hypothetical protein
MVVRWVVTKGDANGSRKIGVSRLVFQIWREIKVQTATYYMRSSPKFEYAACQSP